MTINNQLILILFITLSLGACASSNEQEFDVHPGILWVQTAAEFDAIGRQVYRAAGDALAAKISDLSWSALPEQNDAAMLPPAIIFDVDETVVSNVDFQLTLAPPFSDEKLNAWNAANDAVAIPGVVDFAERARALGVELFFITNRPCMPETGNSDPCPQKAVTVSDINEAGIPVSADYVMLSHEKPSWNKEKKNRRDVVAENYRVIMLIGDDLGDFIPCSRRRAVPPCSEGASIASRSQATAEYGDYWGNGWYILPNPMHGSWTSVR
jgi:acid phosphatase